MNKTTFRYIAAAGMVVVFLFGCGGKKGNSVKINSTPKYGWLDSGKTSFYVPIDSFSVVPYHYYCDTINWKAKYDSLLKYCDSNHSAGSFFPRVKFYGGSHLYIKGTCRITDSVSFNKIIDTDTGKIILELN